MQELLKQIFGIGEDLTVVQMAARAFVVFFFALVIIRITGMRSFAGKTAFDNIVVILLGAILSRAVVGASPFLPTIAAAATICLVHKVLAMLAARFHLISHLLKGDSKVVYKHGELDRKTLVNCDLSIGDLEEGIRLAGHIPAIDHAEEIRVERSGQISVVKEA